MSFSPPLTPLVPPTSPSPADDLVRHLSSLNLAHPDTRHDGTDQPLTGEAIDHASEGTVHPISLSPICTLTDCLALVRDFLMVQGSFVDPKAKMYTPVLWKSLKSNLIEAVSASCLFCGVGPDVARVAVWTVSEGDISTAPGERDEVFGKSPSAT